MTSVFWKQVQAWLILSGFTANGELIADGDPGKSTREALKAFQASRGLKRTCRFDDQTASGMLGRCPVGWSDPNRSPQSIIERQCALIILGYTAGDTLVADGEGGPATLQALGDFFDSEIHRASDFTLNNVGSEDFEAA